MAKIQNRLKAKKISPMDKVTRRRIKTQKAFDEAAEQKQRDDEQDAPK